MLTLISSPFLPGKATLLRVLTSSRMKHLSRRRRRIFLKTRITGYIETPEGRSMYPSMRARLLHAISEKNDTSNP